MSEQATIWYQLVKENGDKMGSADKVKLFIESDIADFRDAAKEKNGDLKDIPPRNLKVYANKEALELKTPMKSSSIVAGLGVDEENALYVVVPEPLGVNGINNS
jgi:hypothetical protein